MLKIGDLVFVYGGLGYGIITKVGRYTYRILTFDSNKQAWYPNLRFKRVSE